MNPHSDVTLPLTPSILSEVITSECAVHQDDTLDSIEPDWLTRGRIPGLDGLRGIAVSLVLLNHAFQTVGAPDSQALRLIAYHAGFGVDIFFVISGFLITTLLLRELNSTGSVSLSRFYCRRTLRIMPAYICFLCVVAIAERLRYFHLQPRDWLGAMTYTTNFLYQPSWELVHCWSLSVEEHFYLIWPLVIWLGGVRAAWKLCWTCLVVCWLLRCGIAFGLPSVFFPAESAWADISRSEMLAETCTFTRLDTISMGCLLALAARSEAGRGWLNRLTGPDSVPRYLTLLCISLVLSQSSTYNLCCAYTINGFCIMLLVWGLLQTDGAMRRVLENRALTAVGVGSYSIYLWQQLFLHPIHGGCLHQFPLNIVMALAAAAMSYFLIERPINLFKQRFVE